MSSLVFVGGVPGAGKTTACRAVVDRVRGASHVIAGQLIRDALTAGAGDYERPSVADARTAAEFQDILVAEVGRLRAASSAMILLDGHYVLPTLGGFYRVDLSVFRRLGVGTIVLVEADVRTVTERLRQRTTRTWWDGEDAFITRLVRAEREHARRIADGLPLTLRIVRSASDFESLRESLG